MASAAERVSGLEAALAAAQERERELAAEPPDANRAYLAGPPAPRALACAEGPLRSPGAVGPGAA